MLVYDIGIHNVTHITAKAIKANYSSWVRIFLHSTDDHSLPAEVTIFFSDFALAEAYAAAINRVDKTLRDPKPEPLVQLDDSDEIPF